MLAYFAGPRVGAVVYNLAHTYALAVALASPASSAANPRLWWPPWSGSPISASTAPSASASNMPAASATPTSAAPATGTLVTAIWRIGHARPRHSDRSGADQGEPDRRQRTWPSPSSRPADGCGMVGLAADLRLYDRASRRGDPRRYGRVSGSGRLPRWHPYFRFAVRFDIEPEEEAGPQLRALGIGQGDVKRIVLTHLHIDHDGGLSAFPNSEILAAPGEVAIASGLAGRMRGYLPDRWPKDFDPKPLTLEAVAYGPFARSKSLCDEGRRDRRGGDAGPYARSPFASSSRTRRDGLHRRRCVLHRTGHAVGPGRRRQPRRKRRVPDARRHSRLRRVTADDDLPAHDPVAATRLAERRTGAALGERINTSSGNAASETSLISRKSLE